MKKKPTKTVNSKTSKTQKRKWVSSIEGKPVHLKRTQPNQIIINISIEPKYNRKEFAKLINEAIKDGLIEP